MTNYHEKLTAKKINDIIIERRWNDFLTYNEFDLRIFLHFLNFNQHAEILTELPIDIFKHIIDKSIDLECTDIDLNRPIHHICCSFGFEFIKYLIDKNVDLECKNCNDVRPIHIIATRSDLDALKYIVDKGVNLECVDSGGSRPIHDVCLWSRSEEIKYLIDKGVNLKVSTLPHPDLQSNYSLTIFRSLDMNQNITEEERDELKTYIVLANKEILELFMF